MKNIVLTALLVSISSNCFAQDFIRKSSGETITLEKSEPSESTSRPRSADGDFRNGFWGEKKSIIKEREDWNLIGEDEDALMYSGSLGGKKVNAVYIFAYGKLVRGKYLFNIEHSNKNLFINDYYDLLETLKEKYGRAKDEVVWLNDLYKDDQEDYGLAISIGHLVFESTWSPRNTKLLLQLSGDNYQIELIIQYTSKRFKDLELRKNRNLDEF